MQLQMQKRSKLIIIKKHLLAGKTNAMKGIRQMKYEKLFEETLECGCYVDAVKYAGVQYAIHRKPAKDCPLKFHGFVNLKGIPTPVEIPYS